MIITIILLNLLHQLLTRDAYAADRSVSLVLGDSVCQSSIQQDIALAMKTACDEKGDEQYKSMAAKLDVLDKKLSDLYVKSTRPGKAIGYCPYGYIDYPQEQFCYKFHSECLSWAQARQVCLQEGGDLISLGEANFQFFIDLARSKAGDCNTVWVGTTDINSEGQWSWLNGVNVSSVFWAQGQPDNWASKENCGNMNKNFGYRMNDEDCSSKFHFLCQSV